MKIHKLSAYGLGAFVLTFGATLAFGQARVPFTRPPYLTTSGPISTTSTVAASSYNSTVASGNQAYTCTNTGCRLSLGNTGRYLVDDGTRISSTAPFAATDFTKDDFNNLVLTGRRENSASSVGIIMRNSFALTTAGSKLVSFRNPTTTEIASIDKDGAFVSTSTGNAFVAPSNGKVCLDGSTCSASLTYNSSATRTELTSNASTIVVGSGGVRIAAGSLVVDTALDLPSTARLRNAATVIADSGGAGAASYTQSSYVVGVRYTCNDADGCNVTMSEVGAVDGFTIRFTNEGTNTVNFTDTAGVTELAGNFAMGQWDTLVLHYNVDRWVEVSRSNN